MLLALTTESLGSLLIGMMVGMVLAIPVGPTAVLCMRRTLERGMRFGFATGLGASLADGFYGGVTAFGVAAIQTFLHHHFVSVRLIGGLFMIGLAIRLVRAKGMPEARDDKSTGHAVTAFFSGFLITVTNPMTLVGFAAIFASLHLASGIADLDLDTFLVLGVTMGSALWWFTLTLGVKKLRHFLSELALHRINVGAALGLAVFGAYALFTVALRVLNK